MKRVIVLVSALVLSATAVAQNDRSDMWEFGLIINDMSSDELSSSDMGSGPIRTAQFGNREKRAPRPRSSPEPAVSCSDSPERNGQNPAESRVFLCPSLDLREKSLQQQTGWRSKGDSNLHFGLGETRRS